MTSNYKQVEKELTTIINSNIVTTNEAKLKFNIYYISRKVKNLFIRNNPNKPNQPFNLVYQYTCNQGECTIPSQRILDTPAQRSKIDSSNTQRSRKITNKSTTATLQDPKCSQTWQYWQQNTTSKTLQYWKHSWSSNMDRKSIDRPKISTTHLKFSNSNFATLLTL